MKLIAKKSYCLIIVFLIFIVDVSTSTKIYRKPDSTSNAKKTRASSSKAKKTLVSTSNSNKISTSTSKVGGIFNKLSKEDVKNALEKITSATVQGITAIIPPQFCWKKGADVGIIPTNCPKGMFRYLELCYENCPENYTFVAGVCWEKCHPKSTDIGAFCVGGGHGKTKHSYISKSITNFNDGVSCPEGMYKGGALCYRDCKKEGMVNCGIGACSLDAASCTSAILNIVKDVVTGIAQGIGFVLSFGTSGPGVSALKTSLKALGKGAIKAALKASKNYLVKIGKDVVKTKVKVYVKEKAKEYIKQLGENFFNDFLEKASDSLVSKSISVDVDTFNEEYFISKLDVIGLGDSITKCKSAGDSPSAATDCAGAVLNTISAFDPTGLSAIGAAFMKPVCEKV